MSPVSGVDASTELAVDSVLLLDIDVDAVDSDGVTECFEEEAAPRIDRPIGCGVLTDDRLLLSCFAAFLASVFSFNSLSREICAGVEPVTAATGVLELGFAIRGIVGRPSEFLVVGVDRD